MSTKLTAIAFRTTLIYVILGGLWILFSDRAVASFTSDANLYVKLSTYKGWAFVLVTGTLLYLMLRAQLRRWTMEFEGRKRAESELRQNQERLQLVIENSEDVLIMQDIEGRYVHYSGPKQFGVSASDVLGRYPAELHEAKVAQRILDRHRAVLATGVSASGDDDVCWGGQQFWFSTRVSPARDANNAIIGTVTDSHNITERKKAESVLREKLALQNQIAKIAETVPGMICSFLLRPDGSTCMPFTTRMIEGIYGLRPEDVALDAAPVLAAIHPDDVAHVTQTIAESARTMSPWHDEYRVKHPRKGEIWIEGLSMPQRLDDGGILWHGFVTDITERKKSEEAIRLSESRFRSFVEQAPLAVFETDARGRYIDMNPEAYNLLGFERKELLGKRIEDLTAEGDRVLAISSFWELLEKGRAEGEFRMVRKDQREIWVSDVAVRLDKNRYLSFCRDVTTRRDAEEKLKTSLHEKEVLLKEVHHRVKNNLQVISSLISLQAEELKDPQARAAFRESRQRVRSMALIHENLYQSQNLASIRIRDYIETVTKELRRSFRADGVTFSLDVEAIHLGIDAAVPCGLIINELLTNALKHAFPGHRPGNISVLLHRVSPKSLRLVVEDNGIGFPEGVDFRSLTSMGMTLVISLAQQIEGTLAMERNAGTRFTIDFPA